jgi:hypothetical protein
VRKNGYETIKTNAPIIAPLYEVVPLDLFSELIPLTFKDHHTLDYTLTPQPTIAGQAQSLLERAEDMQLDLVTSKYTTSRPSGTTRPATRPSTRRSTRPSVLH